MLCKLAGRFVYPGGQLSKPHLTIAGTRHNECVVTQRQELTLETRKRINANVCWMENILALKNASYFVLHSF